MIKNSNINISFFGSSEIGFNCYPKNRSYNRFYNSDSIHSWLYEINYLKTKSVYTYVRYGLLTKIDEGRDGSCFGISIEISNYEFSDPLIILQSLLFSSSEKIITEEVLIKKLSLSSDIAFIVDKISDQSEYLDLKSNKILSTLNSKYLDFFRPLNNILNSRKGILKTHPSTSSDVLNSWKNNYNKILISPIYEVLENTPYESALIEEQNKNKQLHKVNNELSLKINELENEIEILQNELNEKEEEQIVSWKLNPVEVKISESSKIPKKEIIIRKLLRKEILIPLFFVFFVIIALILLNSVKESDSKKKSINKNKLKLKNELPYWIFFNEDEYFIECEGFIEKNIGYKIKTISDFKKILVEDLDYYFYNPNIYLTKNADNFQKISNFIITEINRSKDGYVPLINTIYWRNAIQGNSAEKDYIVVNNH